MDLKDRRFPEQHEPFLSTKVRYGKGGILDTLVNSNILTSFWHDRSKNFNTRLWRDIWDEIAIVADEEIRGKDDRTTI